MLNKSASRAINILEVLAKSDRPLVLAEICRELALPKSSALDIIQTLVEIEAIEVADPAIKSYSVGIKMFQIGSSAIEKGDLYKVAHKIIDHLSHETGGTTYLAIRKKNRVLYIDKVESAEPIRSTCDIGSTNYMHLTGLGKAMLAGLGEDIESIVGSNPLPAKTQFSITSVEALIKDIECVKKRGYAIDDKEGMEFVCCVAAPIRDRNSKVVAAISVAKFSHQIEGENYEVLGKKVAQAALEISNKIGYLKKTLF